MRTRPIAPVLPLSVGSVAVPTVPPFVGRGQLLDALCGLDEGRWAVVQGARGMGKTRLSRELARRLYGERVAVVSVGPGEHPWAVLARIEDSLGILPGGLIHAAGLAAFVVIDDADRLGASALAELAAYLHPDKGTLRVVLLGTARPDAPRAPIALDVTLSGLEMAEAQHLWTWLDESFAPSPEGGLAQAHLSCRGVPMGLRHAHAEQHFGAFLASSLSPTERVLLRLASVVRAPAAPQTLARLAGETFAIDVQVLWRRQLFVTELDGRLRVPSVIADGVLADLTKEERVALQRAAARAWQDAVTLGDESNAAHGLHLHAISNDISALEEAVSHDGQRAADVWSVLDSLPKDALSLRLVTAKHESLMRLGRTAVALDVFEELAAKAAEHGGVRASALLLSAAQAYLDAGDLAESRRRLLMAAAYDDGSLRRATQTMLGLVEHEAGRHSEAEGFVHQGESEDQLDPRTRLAEALLAERDGDLERVRALLPRLARDERRNPRWAMQAQAVLACLHAEAGHEDEALAELGRVEERALRVDAVALGDEIRLRRARCLHGAGRVRDALAVLVPLAADLRRRGAVLLALRTELEIVRNEVMRGRVARAGTLLARLLRESRERSLAALAAEASLVEALLKAEERDAASARQLAMQVQDNPAASRVAREHAGQIILTASAVNSRGGDLGMVRNDALVAEREGRHADSLAALIAMARAAFIAGDRPAALGAACRVIEAAAALGLDQYVCLGLLAKGACLREASDLAGAWTSITDAASLARAAELGFVRYAAAWAAEVVASEIDENDAMRVFAAQRQASGALLTKDGIDAAARFVADLGFLGARPFRTVRADGTHSGISDLTATDAPSRSLVVDAVNECVYRFGKRTADLRRRTMLKRLLFVFGAQPGVTLSKEQLVERVWGVSYHPLRHDAALFTNIMRLRRLLGEEGESLLRATEGGYQLAPPADFVYVEAA